MKIKEGFVLRKVADVWIVLSIGKSAKSFSGMLTLNETGVMLWNILKKGSTREELATALTEEFEVSRDQALSDVDAFTEKIKDCIDF